MSKKKTAGIVILALLILLAILIAVNQHLIWVLLKNWFPEKLALDETAVWDGGQSYERLPYAADSASQYLDLYVPDGEDPVPLFVLIHGGGFVGGDSQTRQAQFMIRYFRDHGFACASINYRLAQEAPWPAAVDDVRSAVRFLAAHAQQYGLDAGKIAVWGESAGGYLAAMEAVTETEVPIAALVDYYGIVHFPDNVSQLRQEGIPQLVLNIANGWAKNSLEGYGSCEEYWLRKPAEEWSEEELRSTSVVMQAKSCADPALRTLILHGDADITVAYDQSVLLRDALAASCGAERVELRLCHGYMHAADGFYSDEQLAEVEAFLRAALNDRT